MIWKIFYNTVIVPLGWMGFHVAGLFDRKIRRGIRGRKGLFDRLEQNMNALSPLNKRVWFHSSSMGEFEQAKPIIAELKRRRPDIDVIISFFSPSGYEHSARYKLAQVITYLPFDSPGQAEHFIRLVRPNAAVMVRYDVWPNHVWALRKAGVPCFIANATLRVAGIRRSAGVQSFYRTIYESLHFILTVSEEDRRSFASLKLRGPVLESIGDTRYDQVVQRSRESATKHLLSPKVTVNRRIVVVGSSWPEDEDRVIPAMLHVLREVPDVLLVLVPHEPTIEHLENVEYLLNGECRCIRFSNVADFSGEEVVLVDSVGVLMGLYKYAECAYVGGSFRQGIHNVLEPAAYGIPLVIGPRHQNSQEAVSLVREGGAFMGADVEQLAGHFMRLLKNEAVKLSAGTIARTFVMRNTGATERFLSYLEKVL